MRTAFLKRGLAALLVISGMLTTLYTSVSLAATETVPLERLHIHDVILLPTVRSQYEAQFTKPTTWQVASSSALYLEFQHSIELLPDRSWLQIMVNDKIIKHIPLTKENAEGTKMTIPLPVELLKDFNRLTFRVEQHYTDKCEDPLDKSLWTQILPATKIIFNYTPTVPKVDLGTYPYPIIDPLTYSPAQVHYITTKAATEKELQAMAYLNVHLAQQAQDHELKSRVTFDNPTGPDNEHLIFVGKGGSIPQVSQYQASFGNYALQSGQWVNRQTNQALGNDQGLIIFFQAPGSTEHTVLIVTGNSDDAVMKAAEYLTLRPKDTTLLGSAKEVPPGWSPPGNHSAAIPHFLNTQSRTFRELGFKIEEVHKINAPPITYNIPIVSKFRNSGGKLWLDVVYSYSPQLNPEYSSLELRMNDVSIANIPLTNVNGEQLQRASVPISNELIKPRNDLVAQFHLMPDKYGWCVDNYVDNAWGKILDDSQFRVEGSPDSYLPDVGLLNNTMYPYSEDASLEPVQLAIPAEPTPELLDAMLGFTTRLGRATLADTELKLSLKKGDSAPDANKQAAVFHYATDTFKLPDGAKLIWQLSGNTLMKLLHLNDPNKGTIATEMAELGSGAYMEQYATGGNHVISVFTASKPQGFLSLGNVFESDKEFDTLTQGFLQQTSLLNPGLNPVSETTYHTESKNQAGNWWNNLLDWVKSLPWTIIIIGMVIAFFFLLILPLLIRAIFRR